MTEGFGVRASQRHHVPTGGPSQGITLGIGGGRSFPAIWTDRISRSQNAREPKRTNLHKKHRAPGTGVDVSDCHV